MFFLDGNESFYDEGKRMEVSQKVKSIVESLSDLSTEDKIRRINSILRNVEESIYEVEDDEDFTAYGALVMNIANSDGVTESFGMILSELDIPFEVVNFNETILTGIKVEDKIFAPQVENWCEKNSVDFESWKKAHV